MPVHESLADIAGIGPALIQQLNRMGVTTPGELISYYPRRYDDYSTITAINRLKPGVVSIEATVTAVKGRYARRGLHITEAIASDATGSVRLVWFNQPYRERTISAGVPYFISGPFELRYRRLSIMNPAIEPVSDFPIHAARIVPVYREGKRLKSTVIRRAIRQLLPYIETLPETLPAWLVKETKLMAYSEAVRAIHFPKSTDELAAARRRLGYEEVLQLSLASLLNKYENRSDKSLAITFNESLARKFVRSLPFRLTDAQRRVVWRIYQDLQHDQPMNRLVEGDVGSGKTVVATMAALMVMAQGYQVAFMAPTELLARQHAETIQSLLQPLGLSNQLDLLVGSMSASQKSRARAALNSGHAKFAVGTHALIQEKVNMKDLALVIIDEQHRFGVEQRKALMAKAGHMPHVLSLSATPIPRSLALTLFGELDISRLDMKPANRQPIRTEIVASSARSKLYAGLDKELNCGRQMFVVCPLITDSEMLSAQSVERVYQELSTTYYKRRRVGILHGKLKDDKKQFIMQQFVDHELDVLVATTVIEVGVDVPNATVMVVENAERFGLAQIHQLRGRVGRSRHQGYCYLVLAPDQVPTPRLRALESSDDGFQLAELDLQLRGPGALYGQLQHGQLDLRIARLDDQKLLLAARRDAQKFIDRREDLLQYPHLQAAVTKLRAVTNLN